MSSDDVTKWIASHPKLFHALFAGLIVLSQVGTVVANNSTGTGGP